MIETHGVVTALDGSHAIVRMEEAGCGRCHEPGGCGGQNIGKMFGGGPRLFRVGNPTNACIGDHVGVVVKNAAVHRGALIAYGAPLLALFLGAFLGRYLAGEMGSIIGAVVGVVSAWKALPLLESLVQVRSEIGPQIKR